MPNRQKTAIEDELTQRFAPLNLAGWRYYPVVGSTNDEAVAWAADGAPDGSLVLADAQTAGRGQGSRQWVTQAGAGLAMSLVLRLTPCEAACFPRFTALGPLGLISALAGLGLHGTIKWPNDVLLSGKKAAGVLVEADWQADTVEALVIGLGVNITPAAVPPAENLRYPATSVSAEVGTRVDRWGLLADILREMQNLREILCTDAFIRQWNAHLAFRGEKILFQLPGQSAQSMTLVGVTSDGALSLIDAGGQAFNALSGEILMPG